ncbi:uncharacterized protein LOC130712691 [Lotus japonicus]|uniref:uncharacterized protein LOC130712691 n=1 Tax=Lotus japonicus TaxID=34305 RepID=UPI002587E897|nr:uncharacterized protein LOC130712691 [Lotus japonicus]
MCERFIDGLSYELQRAVQPLGLNRYQVLVEKTKVVEAIYNQRNKYQGQNKSNQGSGGPARTDQGRNDKGKNYQKKSYQRPQGKGTTFGSSRPSGGNGNTPAIDRENVTCFKCNKKGHYANQCPDRPPTCWNCNKPGHTARDCRVPKVEAAVNAARAQRPTTRARVYMIDGAETEAADGLIRSACEIADPGLAEFLNTYFSKLSLKEGALRSLLATTVVDAKTNGVQGVEVVQDFEDVFPEDVPGIPQSET